MRPMRRPTFSLKPKQGLRVPCGAWPDWNQTTVSTLYLGSLMREKNARICAKAKEKNDGAIRSTVAAWSPDSDSGVDLAVRWLELALLVQAVAPKPNV